MTQSRDGNCTNRKMTEIADDDSHGNIEITKVKVTIKKDDDDDNGPIAADIEQGGEHEQQREQQVSSTYNNERRPPSHLEEPSLRDGGIIISNEDASLYDVKFYIHWLLTFGPIGVGVTLYWRGMWTVLDLYLFPDNIVKSAWVSLLLGLCTGVVCHSVSISASSSSSPYDEDGSSDSYGSKILSIGSSDRSVIIGNKESKEEGRSKSSIIPVNLFMKTNGHPTTYQIVKSCVI